MFVTGRRQEAEGKIPLLLALGLLEQRGIELVPLVVLAIAIFLVGIYPNVITGVISSGVVPVMAKFGL